jgi:hypothetical protein
MRTVRTQLLNLIALGFLATFSIGCDDAEPQTAVLGEYFPLEQGLEWKYSQTLLNGDAEPMAMEQTNFRVDGDTTIDGKKYLRIIDLQTGFIEKAIRREGSKYFGRNHELYGGFTHEYVFLDTEINEGSSWHYFKFDGAIKTEYIVKSVTATRTVNGVTYENVLELEVNYYDQANPGEFKLTYSVVHAYAKDIGEIYSYYPYPASGFFGDLRTELISVTK